MITDLGQVTESRVCWPETKPRTGSRSESPFRRPSVDREQVEIETELGRWGLRKFIISKNNQRIYAGDPACAVWWLDRRGELRVLACDKYQTLGANMHAIRLTLEAMRALERWGAYTAEQAAEGARLLALPAPEGADWRRLLGFVSGLPSDKQLVLVEHSYREMSRAAAGDDARQRTLNLAIEAARKELRA